ncbi:MAG: hypothetical protein M1840_004101 [Geoglossum simile]|nr:MAG: hypothetical protein M1840_004101 [Geoglossum simile]
MEPFHHRDMTGNSQHGYFLPSPRSETSFWRSHPPTPRPSYSPPSLLRSPLSLGPVRNITPPEDIVPLNGERHVAVKEPKSPYNQVREYVDCFKAWRSKDNAKRGSLEVYESGLSIKMSMREWAKLSADLNIFETDQKYPRYSYNSSTSTLIVQCMPSPLHESIASIFSDGFAVAKSTLPASVRTKIFTVANEEFRGFGGQYEGSNKTPDLGIKFRNAAGELDIKFVLEVGFAEAYEDLVQDARMWLDGKPEVCVVVLANFEESPNYRCPVRDLDDEDFEQLEFPKGLDVRAQNFNLEGEYGPVTYKGLVWVGRISTAYMEVWKRDPVTKLATQSEDRINLYSFADLPQLGFQLSDFLDIAPEDERTIFFRWDDYRIFIKDQIKHLAVFRCQEMLRDRAKRTGIRDRDYQPSSEGSSD